MLLRQCPTPRVSLLVCRPRELSLRVVMEEEVVQEKYHGKERPKEMATLPLRMSTDATQPA